MTKDVITTYVEFYSEAHFTIGSKGPKRVYEVEDRDLSTIGLIQEACAFRFYDIVSAQREDEEGKFELKSRPRRISAWHIYGKKVYSLDEMIDRFPGDWEMIERATKHEWKELVYTLKGRWCPLKEEYILHPSTPRWAPDERPRKKDSP